MNHKTGAWQNRFELTTCSEGEIDPTIPPTALGVAVIYAQTAAGETISLVLESRSGSLRALCAKRIQTAKIPPGTPLMVSFKSETLPDASPEAVHAACRRQVLLAAQLRRELRPSMR
jgi:hypothetical protein